MRKKRFAAVGISCIAILLSNQTSLGSCGTSLVAIPSPARSLSTLAGVSGSSGSDVWAVGSTIGLNNGTGLYHTLIEHYDGSTWATVPSPNNQNHRGNLLVSVSASNPTDAWAVGYDNNFDYENGLPLAMHWDGSVWSLEKTHALPDCVTTAQLTGISANPSNPQDVWAVGFGGHYGCQPPEIVKITEHWDGRAWHLIQSFGSGEFNAVTTTADGAWAVGWSFGSHRNIPAIAHFSGLNETQWPAPDHEGTLNSVSAISTNDVWAVGARSTGIRPIIEHFDGVKWSSITSPVVNGSSFNSVSAVAPNDVWAVGSQSPPDSPGTTLTLVEHWDGSAWSIVPSQNAGVLNIWQGVYSFGSGAVTVGEFDDWQPTGLEDTLSGISGCS